MVIMAMMTGCGVAFDIARVNSGFGIFNSGSPSDFWI